MENDPLARLRLFPGSAAEQIVALTDLWKSRAKRSFVAMRERMNGLEELQVKLEPAAFDNYFRRTNREKTPEEVIWAFIRIMRDDAWLPKAQQCTLAEALYLAALKNVSVITYARIYQLFVGQEEEFKQLCPLGDVIAEQVRKANAPVVALTDAQVAELQPVNTASAVAPVTSITAAAPATPATAVTRITPVTPASIFRSLSRGWQFLLLTIFIALVVWTLASSIGFVPH